MGICEARYKLWNSIESNVLVIEAPTYPSTKNMLASYAWDFYSTYIISFDSLCPEYPCLSLSRWNLGELSRRDVGPCLASTWTTCWTPTAISSYLGWVGIQDSTLCECFLVDTCCWCKAHNQFLVNHMWQLHVHMSTEVLRVSHNRMSLQLGSHDKMHLTFPGRAWRALWLENRGPDVSGTLPTCCSLSLYFFESLSSPHRKMYRRPLSIQHRPTSS